MTPAVLITRPEAQAYRLADQLRAQWGCEMPIVISPLIGIACLDHPLDLGDTRTLLFTSVNGVEAFRRLSTRRDLPCYTVGPATARVATALGLAVHDAGGDVGALCERMIADRVSGPCLHLRGEVAAGDLVGGLRRAGIAARAQVIYRQVPQPLSDEARAILDADAPVIVPLYSPRSAELFFGQITARAPLLIAAISQNAADKIPQSSCETVIIAQSPDGPAMIAAIAHLRERANQLESTRTGK